jgi:hypothetical protein
MLVAMKETCSGLLDDACIAHFVALYPEVVCTVSVVVQFVVAIQYGCVVMFVHHIVAH